ncbi:MAG TPA: hypothetical protein VFW19_03085 [Allosphingosinicella sp.]|nr:hypothetical protein [Allosphingosinicella sp.]
MDIHKPKLAHSLREFLAEIGTITVGILIALGLESAVEAYHNRRLVDRARIELRAELRSNRDTLADTISQEKKASVPLAALLAYGRARLQGRPARLAPDLQLNMRFVQMSTAGWDSALATQALVHMPYDQAHALSVAYAGTRVFNDYEADATRHWMELNTWPDDPGTLSHDQLQAAVHELALNQGYQQSLIASGAHLLLAYDKAIAALR